MAQSVDLLYTLFEGDGQEVDMATSRALAIDDQQDRVTFRDERVGEANLKSQALSGPLRGISVAQEWEFDLIVLDHSMPGMTGAELCAKFADAANYKTTPILFVTSARVSSIAPRFGRSGASDVIAKPFLATELGLKALTLIISRSSPSRSRRFAI